MQRTGIKSFYTMSVVACLMNESVSNMLMVRVERDIPRRIPNTVKWNCKESLRELREAGREDS